MAGRLKKIVDHVKARSFFKNLAISMLNMKLNTDVERFSDNTPDDPELEKKLIEAAKEVLGKDKFDLVL